MSESELDGIFSTHFESISQMVNDRQKRTDYHWLFDSSDTFFTPDYFTIGTLGRNFFERGLNLLISNRFGRFGLSYRVVSRFVLLFYDLPMFAAVPHCEWLLKKLRSMPKQMVDWSLVEFFLFMERWMTALISKEFMTFSSQKVALNEFVRPVLKQVDLHDVSDSAFAGAVHAACYANWFDVIVPDFEQRQSASLQLVQQALNQHESVRLDHKISTFINAHKQQIMYEFDNAGEVILDLIVITKLILKGHKVIMVAKYGPILNDVTVSDISELIQTYPEFSLLRDALTSGNLSIISANNFPMVGKYIPLATKEYQIAAQACDMFWLKGQANFQTMPVANHGLFKQRIKYKKPIMLNFIVKAPIVRYCLDHSEIGHVTLGNPLITLI